MRIEKNIDFSNKTIQNGYIYLDGNKSQNSLSDIVSNVNESIFIIDTNDLVSKQLFSIAKDLLINRNIIFVGLFSYDVLKKLKVNGISDGFFRSTLLKFQSSIIIIDKKKAYVCYDENHVYPININDLEIFDYVNHIFWTNTNAECVLGELKVINESNLTVPAPLIKHGVNKKDVLATYKYSTSDFNSQVLLSDNEVDMIESYVISVKADSVFGNELSSLYVKLFNDTYYNIESDLSFFEKKSFNNLTISQLFGKRLSINEKEVIIKDKDVLLKTVNLPLDIYKSYQPDFISLANEYKGYVKNLQIIVDINPIVIDSSFKLSSRYEERNKVLSNIQINLNKVKNLITKEDDDLLKQIIRIEKEAVLKEKISLYNKFFNENEFGDKTLRNANVSVSLKYDLKLEVPNELIGKLYTKQNQMYFALTSEFRIDDAKSWLQENKLEAILVKENV